MGTVLASRIYGIFPSLREQMKNLMTNSPIKWEQLNWLQWSSTASFLLIPLGSLWMTFIETDFGLSPIIGIWKYPKKPLEVGNTPGLLSWANLAPSKGHWQVYSIFLTHFGTAENTNFELTIFSLLKKKSKRSREFYSLKLLHFKGDLPSYKATTMEIQSYFHF